MLFDNVLWPLGLTRSDKKDQILIEISITIQKNWGVVDIPLIFIIDKNRM